MKRLVVLAVLFSLAVSFAALQPAPVAAQSQNCFIHISQNLTTTVYYWATETTTSSTTSGSFLSNVLSLSGNASGVIVVNKGVTGTVQVRAAGSFPGSAGDGGTVGGLNAVEVNCIDDNNEFDQQCGKLGLDFPYRTPSSTDTVIVTVFYKGNPIFTQTFGAFAPSNPNEQTNAQVVVPVTDFSPSNPGDYTYRITCPGGCNTGNTAISPTGFVSGPLTYLCTPACGPALEGAPLGRMLATVPLHAAPNAGAASPTFSAEAGKTFKMLGTQGGFTRIALGCQSYWVPSNAIAQCADPLCRD